MIALSLKIIGSNFFLILVLLLTSAIGRMTQLNAFGEVPGSYILIAGDTC